MHGTQIIYVVMRLMGTPFWSLLCMLTFILYKNASVTPLEIAIIIALKPASSLLSPYWSQAIYQRQDKIVLNLMGANFLRYLPFLFVPWIHGTWFMIFAFGLHMTLTRATIPGWMEFFKWTLPKEKREELVGYGSTIDFVGTALLTVVLGIALDKYPEAWRYLFAGTAFLGIFSTWFLTKLSVPKGLAISACRLPSMKKIGDKILKPWNEVWKLICNHRDFAIFQIGFTLGGAGLMIMQPALPRFFVDILKLSYLEMGLAIAFCKGIGVALTTPLWTRLFRKLNIYHFSALVTLFAALFPFILFLTTFHIFLLYVAYVLYGVMQGGSEMSWHMSGLTFSGEKDSSIFSITNVLTVGVRGCIIPIIGSLLLSEKHPLGIVLIGAALCLTATGYFLFHGRLVNHPKESKAQVGN